MANAREIINRRKAVRNIRKITKVMQMVATSRYQKAYKRAVATKPYVRKLSEMVASVSQSARASGEALDLPLLREPAGAGRAAVLVITSNRGLAGGYNGNILRVAQQTMRALESAGKTVDLHVSGKKGLAYFRFNKRATAGAYTNIGDKPAFADIEPLANAFIAQYSNGEIDALKVIYMRFISVGQQKPHVLDVMPLTLLAQNSALPGSAASAPEDGGPGLTSKMAAAMGGAADAAPADPYARVYMFAPSARELLEDLLPATVRVAIFQAFIDAAVSEQIARMVAMKAATDNAETMSKLLTQEYNRARQSQITSELAELMGGVEALK